MRGRSRGGATLAVLGAFFALSGVCAAGAAARPHAHAASGPVHLSAAFGRGAALGSSTALAVDLRLDPARLTTAQLTEVRFEYPQSLGVVSSGLGLAACTRPASDFAKVLINASGLAGCPANAVMGYGTARAVVRLTDGQVIPEYASVALLSGAFDHGKLGLVVYVTGERPFGAMLAFAGAVEGAPAPYGGALSMQMPVVPGLQDLATVSLVQMRIVIGSPAIRYYEHRGGAVVSYHPEGVELPARCPRGGFRFRVSVGFADGTSRSTGATTRCPRRPVALPRTGR